MKSKSRKSTKGIVVGDISNSIGVAVGQNAKAEVVQNIENNNVENIFVELKEMAENLPVEANKNDAKEAITKLEEEATKGELADESRIHRWLKFLGEASPDIWDVAVETFSNPIKGLSTVFKKIAERARADH